MLRSSKAHLASVGESYWEHMRFALLVGVLTVGAGLACILHAVVPALCERTCSRTVVSLQKLFADRSQLSCVVSDSSGLIIFVGLTAISLVTALVMAICTAGTAVGFVVIPEAIALPLIFISKNPGLDPLSA